MWTQDPEYPEIWRYRSSQPDCSGWLEAFQEGAEATFGVGWRIGTYLVAFDTQVSDIEIAKELVRSSVEREPARLALCACTGQTRYEGDGFICKRCGAS